MWVLSQVACGDDYAVPATIAFVYESNGGYATVRDQAALCEIAWSVGGDQGSEQWTQEFRTEPGNLALTPGIIGIRFRNAVAGQVATISAVLSSRDEPSVYLTAAGVSGGGGGGGINWAKVGVNCLQGGGIAWSKVGANCV